MGNHKVQAKICPQCGRHYTIRREGKCPGCGIKVFYPGEPEDLTVEVGETVLVWDRFTLEWSFFTKRGEVNGVPDEDRATDERLSVGVGRPRSGRRRNRRTDVVGR